MHRGAGPAGSARWSTPGPGNAASANGPSAATSVVTGAVAVAVVVGANVDASPTLGRGGLQPPGPGRATGRVGPRFAGRSEPVSQFPGHQLTQAAKLCGIGMRRALPRLDDRSAGRTVAFVDGSGGIGAVLGRIQRIEARFAPPPVDGEVPVAPPTPEDFEPFGEVYQRAVAARSVDTGVTGGAVATARPGSALPFAVPVQASLGSAAAFGVPPDLAASYGMAAAAIGGVAGPPGARPVGGYGAMPIPADLKVHGNGTIPASALARVDQAGANHRLHAPAAASWNNLVAEAAANGFELRITDSYRSYDQQVDLVRRKGLYSQGGYAAVPGTSNHGWGLAVDADVRNPDLQRWLQVNAPRFGWVEAVPREPWHWEFRPNQV